MLLDLTRPTNVSTKSDIHYSPRILSITVTISMLGKAIPIHAWTGPEGSRGLRLPELLDNRHINIARLLALRTSRICPQETSLVLISVKQKVDPIGNRTRVLPACSAVPQPTASPRNPPTT